jgi:Phosphotransferase enzyme family
MATPPPRTVTLVLVDAAGAVLGSLPPFEVDTPWWQDMAPVVRAVQMRDGLQVTVLRLLDTALPAAHGGAVTYLAQADAAAARNVPPRAWSGRLPDDPKRHAYACVGGPAADLAWAEAVLRARGDMPAGAAEQIRSWNLSSLWRLPTRSGVAWLKVVPPFFAHEAAVLNVLADAPVPQLLGHDGARMLMAELPGSDRYEALLPERLRMVDLLVDLQARWCGRVDELLALGLPDWRGPALTEAVSTTFLRHADALDADERSALETFIAALPRRFAAIATCGMPDGLVHGDFHPGNLRGDGNTLAVLDWGDSGVGHPLLDQTAFLRTCPADEIEPSRSHWRAAWRRHLPGADTARASQLLGPVATARSAVIYQRFLDRIERAEHGYHRDDPLDYLRRTAALAIIESSSAASAAWDAR